MKIVGKTNQRFGAGASPGENREGEMTRYQIIATRSPASIFGAAQYALKSNGLSVIYDERADAEAHAARLNRALRKWHMHYAVRMEATLDDLFASIVTRLMSSPRPLSISRRAPNV